MARRTERVAGGSSGGTDAGPDGGIVVVPLDGWRDGAHEPLEDLGARPFAGPPDPPASHARTLLAAATLAVAVTVGVLGAAPWLDDPGAAPRSTTPAGSTSAPDPPATGPDATGPDVTGPDATGPDGGGRAPTSIPTRRGDAAAPPPGALAQVWLATELPPGFVPVAFTASPGVTPAHGELAIWAESRVHRSRPLGRHRLGSVGRRSAHGRPPRPGRPRTTPRRPAGPAHADVARPGRRADGDRRRAGPERARTDRCPRHHEPRHRRGDAARARGRRGRGRAGVHHTAAAALDDLPRRISLSGVPPNLHHATDHRTSSVVSYATAGSATAPVAEITVRAARTMSGDLVLPRFTWLPWDAAAGGGHDAELDGRRFVVGEDPRAPGTRHVRWQDGRTTVTVSGPVAPAVLLDVAAAVRTATRVELGAIARAVAALPWITLSDPLASPPRYQRIAEGTAGSGEPWFASVSASQHSILVSAGGDTAPTVVALHGAAVMTPGSVEIVERWSLSGVLVAVVLPAGSEVVGLRVAIARPGESAAPELGPVDAALAEVDGVLAGAAVLLEGGDVSGDVSGDVTGEVVVELLGVDGATVRVVG